MIFQGFTLLNENDLNSIIGFYWSPKKNAKIEIYLKAKEYFGKFVWMAAPRKDIKNPAKALHSRDVNGLEFLQGFSFHDGVYSGGEIYDPETGKTYSCNEPGKK